MKHSKADAAAAFAVATASAASTAVAAEDGPYLLWLLCEIQEQHE